MKYIGRLFEYTTHSRITRTATCKSVEFHQGIGKWLFIGISQYGNIVRLTKNEIDRFR